MSFSQLAIENIKPEVLSLTIIELINNANVSVRLRNSINSAAADGNLPFKTVADFISSGDEVKALLLKLHNLGARTADELINLVNNLVNSQNQEANSLLSPDYLTKSLRIEDLISPEVLSLSVQDLVNTSNVSVRLKNAINQAVEKKILPYNTIEDVIYSGHKAKQLLLNLPNIGKETANEFIELINNITHQNNLNSIAFSTGIFTAVTGSIRQQKYLKKANQFLSSYNDGFSFAEIAELYGVSKATVRKYLNEHPDFTPINVEKNKKRLEKSNQFLELYKQGLTYQEIGDQFNLSRERVRQLLDQNVEFHEYLKECEDVKVIEGIEREELKQQKLAENSIGNLYPERVAELWDYEKNEDILPDQVQVSDTLIYIWLKCPIDGFSWKKKPSEIARYSWERGTSGCPACRGLLKKAEKQPTLEDIYPEFIKLNWNYAKNDLLGLNPSQLTLASNRKIWLKCPHDGHEWEARIAATIKQQWSKGNAGCRVCNGTIHNKAGEWTRRDPLSLEFPKELEKYWDYTKNNELKIYPDKVSGGSARKVWFRCPVDGFEWFSAIAPTVSNWKEGKSGCSRCGKGWTTEAIRQFVASMEKHIPYLTQAERYKIFEQAGVFNSKASESVAIIKSIIKGKLSGQKLNEFARGIDSKTIEPEQDTTQQLAEAEELRFLDTDSKLETSNIIDHRVEITETTNTSDELPTIKVRNSLEFLSSQIVASADQEAIDYFVASRLNRIWAEVFMDESAVEAVESFTDEGYGRQVRDKFLDEYYQARDMLIPTGWAFRINGKITAPNLMQKLSAVRLRNQKRMLNLSLTGTGKTIGGILSSRIIDARLSIIICPLDTIPNWNAEIKHTFPDSKVTIKNFDPYWESIESGHHYILLNHEMFQQPSSPAHVRRLLERFKIDLIIVDEIHRCKQRSEDTSKRRQIVLALITNAAEINPDLHVLGMSATPVINNLKEGKSLVELVSGLERSDLGERATINNCMRIHQAFVTLGIRSRVKPKITINRITIPIDCSDVVDEIREIGTSVLKMEQILTRSRIPVILQEIRPKTIIYTHYVDGIVDQLEYALEKAGWTVGFHIGGDKSGRDTFINGSVDVLIASSAMAVGVDGFQRVCDRLILNIPPWTSAELEQLEGRLNRQGQIHETLNIISPVTYGLDQGEHWSWDEGRLARLKNKQTIADAAVDGVMPDGQLRSEAQAFRDLRGWLNRLKTGEQKPQIRPVIRVPLPEVDITDTHRRNRQYGDFSRMNALWNNSYSDTNYRRLQNNPEEWMQYHTLYQEARKSWPIIPYKEAIKWLGKRSNLVVADFGCGEAKIAQALAGKHIIHSFDFIAINESVIECDVAHVPLEDSCLDVVMFNLSLMGRNSADYIKEAARTLRLDGQLWIYETLSHIKDVKLFENSLELFGFRIIESKEVWKFWYIRAIKSEFTES
ncbi:MAG: zinc-ribbon domain-containing protein [Methylophilaceae bacterium]